jgi:two-component system, NarL family, response regulator YdfI
VDRQPTRVLVAADSEVEAARLEAMLARNPDWRVLVGTPGTLGRGIAEHDPAAVVLASQRGIAILGTVADAMPVPPVVVLVEDPRAAWTPAARRAGVRAVLDRHAAAEEVSAALVAALAGLVTLHPRVFRAPAGHIDLGRERVLTTREVEILDMLAEGLGNRAIARRLGISTYTVKFHVASLLGKLGAATRTEAVTLALRRGLISL